ncbi:MAG: hypothetical protein LBH59_10705 [Planctomycetaceae bacterium]|jgi:hypothetical protein|nr:hypothetical protein [Planctomycetaceae bacterium]
MTTHSIITKYRIIIRFVTIILFLALQVMLCSVVFSVTKNIDEVRELGRVESADGLVQARLTVTPPKPRLSDTIILRLEVEADTSVKIDMPEFGDFIGTLKVSEINEDVNSASAKKEKRTLSIKTIPTQAGITPIWTIPITYYNRQSDTQEKKKIIDLQSEFIEIDSAVSPDSATLEGLGSGYKLLSLENNLFWWVVAISILVLAILVILLFWIKKRRKTTEQEPELSPQQIALMRIAKLVEERLHEVDVKLFFVELSGVVRWYIEQQTSIRVPELTTEEFLKEISQNHRTKNIIPDEFAKRLKLFLESADMVKFAKFKPTQEEITQGIKYAQVFIIKWINKPQNT